MQHCGLSPMLGLCEPDADGRIRPCCSARPSRKSSAWERGHSAVIARVMVLPVGKHEIGIGLEESRGWSMKLGCLIANKQLSPWHILWWIFLSWTSHTTPHLGSNFSKLRMCFPIQPTLSSLDHTEHIFWAALGLYLLQAKAQFSPAQRTPHQQELWWSLQLRPGNSDVNY